jgi:NAD(P)-dependent dehydrogenase (short-subunit alcohol dehydrogenase family)
MTEEVFDHVFSINVTAPYFLVAELAPQMAKRGKGAIVNLSTMVVDAGAFHRSKERLPQVDTVAQKGNVA